MTDNGIVIGQGTLLVRMAKGASAGLALDADRDRFHALMSIAIGRPVSFDAFRHIEAADRLWQSGDKALANLRLIFADLPSLSAPEDAWRLTLAEHLLDNGMKPNDLITEVGLSVGPIGFDKFSPDQPRVPAGHGRESGRFTSGGAGRVSFSSGASMPETALLAPVGSVSADTIAEGIARLLPRLAGPVAFIAAMAIPTPNSGGVDEGTLPDMPDVHFRRDGPAGTLELTTRDPNGTDVTIVALNQAGAYVDARTGAEIGRDLGSSISLDQSAVRAVIDAGIDEKGREGSDSKPRAATDKPEVCPAPEQDRPHGPKGLDYEDDVHARVNPSNALRRGEAVRVWDPGGAKFIYIDDCFKTHGDLVDGDMKPGDFADAKGDEYEELFGKPFGESVLSKLRDQGEAQVRAAAARGAGVKWYFAQKGAADFVRKNFEEERLLSRITISHMPPRKVR